jgi:NitT/TauT family transport system substrate-binding protein
MRSEQRNVSRRKLVEGLILTGIAGAVGVLAEPVGAEPPPETATLRVAQAPAICFAAKYVAGEQLFSSEGFRHVQYVKSERPAFEALLEGKADLAAIDAATLVMKIEAGAPIVALVGLHVGCYELFGTDRVRSVSDLRGKRIAIPGLHSGRHLMLASMLGYVGIDPNRDVTWVTHPAREAMQLLAAGKVDAFFGFPPEPQELRAKGIGRLLVSMTVDRPWSQHFCCVVAGHRDFVRKYPVATKRALRAILKATSVCAMEPERTAKYLVDGGFAQGYEWTLQTLKELPYGKWREFDSEATVRFYALRLREVGLIKSSPQKIIAEGTDWRFVNELRRELKG